MNRDVNENHMPLTHKDLSFDDLFKQYYGLVFKIAYDFFENIEDAKDARNTVFKKLWKNGEYKNARHMKAFLRKTTRNVCIDMIRSRSTHEQYTVPLIEPIRDHTKPDPITELELDDVIETVLTDQEKLIFKLRFEQNRSIQTIAELLDESRNEISKKIASIREKISKELYGN